MTLNPSTAFAFTRDLIDQDLSQTAVLERELFRRAAGPVMQVPSSRVCREVALELIARAGAADHIGLALVCHHTSGGDTIDWSSCGVSVRKCIDREIYAGARGPYGVRNFRARAAALRAAIATGRLPGDRVVWVDRAFAARGFGALAHKWLDQYSMKLAFIDPGPWGLTDGSCQQICRALGIDAPGPQPRRVQDDDDDDDDDEELF